MLLSFEISFVGAFVLYTAGAVPTSCYGQGRRSVRSRGIMCKQAIGVPRELERS